MNNIYELKDYSYFLKKEEKQRDKILNYIKIIIFDKTEQYRKRKIFKNEEHINKIKYKLINDLKTENNILKLIKIYLKYIKKYKKNNKIKPTLKIGLIGNENILLKKNIEEQLKKEINKKDKNIVLTNNINLSYLLIYKKILSKISLLKSKNYLKYNINDISTYNIHQTLKFISKKYNGIIHIKEYGTNKETIEVPIINKITKEKNIPTLFLTTNNNIKKEIEIFINNLK